MAKVTAPLLSFGASGTIGKTATFAVWRGVKYARQRVTPANPRTVAQQSNRVLFAAMGEMWKVAPVLVQSPWNAFAQGRPFTGRNKMIGENVRVIGGEADMQNFIGSPGARGGLIPTDVSAVAGGASGEIDVSFTNPAAPTGWALASAIACAFPDQDPTIEFGGPIVADEDAVTFNAVTLAGLGSAVSCVVAGWLQWTKPDGSTAYSVGISTTSLSAA